MDAKFEKAVNIYLENPNWTIDKIQETLTDLQNTKRALAAKEITPRSVIGTGYAAGQSRRIANEWLDRQISIHEETLKRMKARSGSKEKTSKLGDYTYIKRKDISVLKATVDGVVLDIDPKDILSGAYVAGKIKATEAKLRVAKVDPEKVREGILNFAKEFLGKEYKAEGSQYEPFIKLDDIKKFIEYGCTEEMIRVFYAGWKSLGIEIKADGEFLWGMGGGIFSFNTEGGYIENWIERAISNAKNKTFELGFKYPDFNWSKLLTRTSGTEVIITSPYQYFGKERIDAIKFEKFKYGTNTTVVAVKSGGYSQNGEWSTSYDESDRDANTPLEINGGYMALVSRNGKDLFALAKKLLSQPNGYVKDLDWLVQSKTTGAEELVENKVEFARGGAVGTYVVVSKAPDGYLVVMSKPTTKAEANKLAKMTTTPKGEVISVMATESVRASKKVLGREYLAKGGGIEEINVGDKVIWKGKKYTFAKITEDRVAGLIDKKYHLHSYQVGVEDAVLDSLNGVTKDNTYSKGGNTYANGGNTQVAETIAQQLGGTRRLQMMTGAYNFGTSGNDLRFRIKNRSVNYIKIVLNGKDLYDVEFGRVRGTDYKVVKKFDDVYFDELIPLFEENTGMYLRFSKGGKMYNEGGRIDLFEDYENIPSEVAAIMSEYELEDNDYQTLEELQGRLETEAGYTFDFGLDAEPYGLRPVGVPITELEGYEEYAKGGGVERRKKLTKAVLMHHLYKPSGDYFFEPKEDGFIVHLTSRDAAMNIDNLMQRFDVTPMGKGYHGAAYFVREPLKANVGAFIAGAETIHKVAPKSTSAIDSRMADQIGKKTFIERMNEPYAKGGGVLSMEAFISQNPIEKQADGYYRLFSASNNFTIMYSKSENELKEYRKKLYSLHKSSKYAYGGGIEDVDFMSTARTNAREGINWNERLREYAGSHYEELTEQEKEEIIADMKADYDFHHSYAVGGNISVGEEIIFDGGGIEGERRGTIVSNLGKGQYEVQSGFGYTLVTSDEIISRAPKSPSAKKWFGIFKYGGRTK